MYLLKCRGRGGGFGVRVQRKISNVNHSEYNNVYSLGRRRQLQTTVFSAKCPLVHCSNRGGLFVQFYWQRYPGDLLRRSGGRVCRRIRVERRKLRKASQTRRASLNAAARFQAHGQVAKATD